MPRPATPPKRVLMVWETEVTTDEQGRARLTPVTPVDSCDLTLACRILGGVSPRTVQELAKRREITRAACKLRGGYDLASVLACATRRRNREVHRTGHGTLLDPPLPTVQCSPLFTQPQPTNPDTPE